jgi:hypothetical protein
LDYENSENLEGKTVQIDDESTVYAANEYEDKYHKDL